jgi:hypothetical protein
MCFSMLSEATSWAVVMKVYARRSGRYWIGRRNFTLDCAIRAHVSAPMIGWESTLQ